jgi:dTDP-4-dehydrorhamnose reductase
VTLPEPIVVLGGSGLLGEALLAELRDRGRASHAPGREELDLEDDRSIEAWIEGRRVAAVINAAAYTDVTRAELPSEHDSVFRLNRDAPATLARVCHRLGVPMVFVSTDFVFDGAVRRPYTEDQTAAPLQVYGRSKLEGEQVVREAHAEALVVRTSTLYGPGRRGRPHYVEAILEQAGHADRIEVVRTPVSSPTYTPDLARALIDLLEVGAVGLVHVVNSGACSRLELARETVRMAGAAERVAVRERPESRDGPRRPAYSVLDATRFVGLVGRPLRSWQDALAAYVGSRITG